MFDDYKKFEEIKDKNYDLENLNPTTLLPLICNFGFSYSENLMVFRLPKSREEQQDMEFVGSVVEKINPEYGGQFVLRHILSELTYNIHEHAFLNQNNSNGMISIKDYGDKLDIAIIDKGLSIPGRFEKSDIEFTDDCHAIEKAINNFSTVSDNPFERGNGLWTTIRLVVEGNGGEVLIVSRKGCLYIFDNDYYYSHLNDEYKFEGTLISIRLNKYEVQNIYDLIELPRNNFYKYGGDYEN